MSLLRLANSLSKGRDRPSRQSTSNSSVASWSPSNSASNTPLASTLSLPEHSLPSNLERMPSTTQSVYSTHSVGGHGQGPGGTPLRIVAPFVYNAPAEAAESRSSLGSNETKSSGTKTLKLKQSLTKFLGKDDEQSHQYHYQKQSLSRKSSKDDGELSDGAGRKSRKGSFFGVGGSSEHLSSASSGTKKLKSWIGQNGVTKKVQEVLKSGGPSSLHVGVSMPKTKSRISSEYHDDGVESDRSSISSAPSFVQTVPEDEVSRILSEPDIMPSLPMQPMQAPFQIPTNVFLPRSHTNLHAFTLASLAFPPSLHPLLYIPNMPAFPRSSNPSSKLPRLPTFRAHLAKTRILDRLEAQDLSQAENESIMPFARENAPTEPYRPPIAEGESEEGRKINDHPGKSMGLETWTRRPPFLDRKRVWQSDDRNGDDIKYEPLSASRFRTEVVISGGIKALAGLLHSRPSSRELPDVPTSPAQTLPMLPAANGPSISVESFATKSVDSVAIDESMLMDSSEALPTFTRLQPAVHVSAALPSPRPLPNVPAVRGTDVQTPAMAVQQMYWDSQEQQQQQQQQLQQQQQDSGDSSPVLPVRPLPPRPLPMPPSAMSPPQVMMDELESVDGPVIVTTANFTPTTSPRQSARLMSPPNSANGHTTLSHSGMPSSSTITSAPHTPLDPLEIASLRRLSVGSMGVALSSAAGFSLEEMDGLDTVPHDLDSKRRSVASFKTSVHKRQSIASRTSHASSPSLLHHPLPTLSESSRYSESSHPSSRQTSGSASTSTEKLSRRLAPSLSESLERIEPPIEELPSPTSIAPVMKGDDQPPLEPSRNSEEYIDPFLIPRLSAVGGMEPRLNLDISSSPLLSEHDTEKKHDSAAIPSLSLKVDVASPLARMEQRSPLGAPSPISMKSSSNRSDSPFSTDADGKSSTSGPVKFVKLKRSPSTNEPNGLNGVGPGRLQRTFKDPSMFWPHSRRVDEKAEPEEEESRSVKSADKSTTHSSWLAERESLRNASKSPGESEIRPDSGISTADTVVPNQNSKLAVASVTDLSSSPSTTPLSNLPPDIVMDVARLSDTSKLDLSLISFKKTPPPTETELQRSSISSAPYSEVETAARSADVREIAANIAPVPSFTANRIGVQSRHSRTPSSERAARIDAHLASVSASRYHSRLGPQQRPDFLPYPGNARPDHGRYSNEEDSYSDRGGGSNRPSGESYDHGNNELSAGYNRDDGVPTTPPPGYGFSQVHQPYHPVSRAPARWSETAWRDRQRALNTLPLPSASISPSATRALPVGAVLNRTGSISASSSSSPSIFRPPGSHSGTTHSRSLRY